MIKDETTNTTHYEILGVGLKSTYDEIKAAYHKFARQSHPDKQQQQQQQQQQSQNHERVDFKLIQLAWETLRNEEIREKYDDDLRQQELRSKSRFRGALTLTSEDLEEAIDEEDNTMYVYDCRCGEEVFVCNWDRKTELFVGCEGCCFVYKVCGTK
jgi:DnaJ-class molecular chaperone